MKMNIFSCFCLKGCSSSSGALPTTGSPENLKHFQEEKSISTLSSLQNLANFTVCSDVLYQTWEAICESKERFNNQLSGDLNVHFTESELTKYKIIAFVTPPITESRLSEKRELVSSSPISGFDFLQSSKKKIFINEAAVSLFHSRKAELSTLVDEAKKSAKPYIITGDGIGGSVASLFALSLLHRLDKEKAKPPLCVTFGSPLLGDREFQEAIAQYCTWNSLFLHVVSIYDGFPSLFVQLDHPDAGDLTTQKITYYPFGRFLFCSSSGGLCVEDPKSALELLKMMSTERKEQNFDYGSTIASLKSGMICKDRTKLIAHDTGESRGRESVAAQYLAGLHQLQDIGQKSQLKDIIKNEISVLAQKREKLEKDAEALNNAKIDMVNLGWYKKKSEYDGMPYYDHYKSKPRQYDFDVIKYKVSLEIYWDQMVKEAEQKPQKEGAALRKRWLFSGTTYRRMVEPLVIADYYSEGYRDYITQGRLKQTRKHFKKLQQWFEEDPTKEQNEKRKAPLLTEDSCFWAHVEEAIISCGILNRGESTGREIENLKEFEEYVLERIKNYEVSSDIFWEKSSFMKWWGDYEKILDKKLMGTSYASRFAEFMRGRKYILYESGKLFG